MFIGKYKLCDMVDGIPSTGWKTIELDLPDYQIIHVAVIDKVLYCWVPIDENNDRTKRTKIQLVATGQIFTKAWCRHVGTVIDRGYVTHVYQEML